jgi:hypothetical protein
MAGESAMRCRPRELAINSYFAYLIVDDVDSLLRTRS